MPHRFRFFLILGLLSFVPLSQGHAQDITAFDFLRIPMNARAAALGNTTVTLRNDVSTMFVNPASLSTLESPSGSVGFFKHLLDVNAGYAVFGQEFEGIGYAGVGVVYLNYGSFEETDRFGDRTGREFGAGELAVNFGYGRKSGDLHYGATVKFIHAAYEEYSSSAAGLDLGIAYHFPDEQLVLAGAVTNLGTQLSTFAGVDESLPLDVRIGIGKQLEHLPLHLLFNLHKLNESQESFFDRFKNFSLGGEFDLSDALKARVGYHNELRRELKIGNTAKLAGFSGGFGLKISTYILDYAYNSLGEIGALHRFSLSTSF